jgi:hypothetical protein
MALDNYIDMVTATAHFPRRVLTLLQNTFPPPPQALGTAS